jgi:hypothetical protein
MRYLTLYSPAMMDIKYFKQQDLIKYENNKYVGVAAITNDKDVYAVAIGSGAGRPEFLALADLNDLLVRPYKYPKYSQSFRDMFPFDVMNLDYCDSLFWQGNQHEISLHVNALNTAINLQKRTKARKFALLLTTRADLGQLASHFLANLAIRIDDNISRNIDFKQKYESLYANNDGASLLRNMYGEFVPLGMVKFIANLISSNGFEVVDCETAYLIRNEELPERWLLHTAFSVALPRATLRSLGRPFHLERNVVQYLDRRKNGNLIELTEKADKRELEKQHGNCVSELAKISFELPVPEPE